MNYDLMLMVFVAGWSLGGYMGISYAKKVYEAFLMGTITKEDLWVSTHLAALEAVKEER